MPFLSTTRREENRIFPPQYIHLCPGCNTARSSSEWKLVESRLQVLRLWCYGVTLNWSSFFSSIIAFNLVHFVYFPMKTMLIFYNHEAQCRLPVTVNCCRARQSKSMNSQFSWCTLTLLNTKWWCCAVWHWKGSNKPGLPLLHGFSLLPGQVAVLVEFISKHGTVVTGILQ